MRGSMVVRLLAVAGACASASADQLSWKNASGGSVALAGNWNPSQIPTANDKLTWNLAGTYTVTFPASVSSSNKQTYRSGTVTLDIVSPHTISTSAAEPVLVVGLHSVDTVTMRQISGRLTCTDPVEIASAAGGSGTMVVDGASTEFIIVGDQLLSVGKQGTGRLDVSTGALLDSAGAIVLGNAVGSTGTSFVGPLTNVNDRATLRTSNDLSVGFSGAGTLTIFDGGLVDVGGDARLGVNASGVGTVTVQGVNRRSSSLIVDSSLSVGSSGAGVLNIMSFGGVACAGPMTIANASVANLDGGTLSAASITVNVGGTLNARGLIEDPIDNNGVFTATSILTLSNAVQNDGSMGGAAFVFDDGAEVVTNGDIDAAVDFADGVLLHVGAPCAIGDASRVDGFTGLAAVDLDADATFLDADDIEIGSLVGSANLDTSGSELVLAGGLIAENVTVDAPRVEGAATIIPGSASSQEIGALAFTGHLEMGAGAVVELDLTRPLSDSITVGTIALNGCHLRIRAMPGYTPRSGDAFVLLAASSITGSFTVDLLPDGMEVTQLATEIRISSTACAGDFDGNGTLNIFDFLAFQTAFGNGDLSADIDGSGTLNIFDFLGFQTAFGNGC